MHRSRSARPPLFHRPERRGEEKGKSSGSKNSSLRTMVRKTVAPAVHGPSRQPYIAYLLPPYQLPATEMGFLVTHFNHIPDEDERLSHDRVNVASGGIGLSTPGFRSYPRRCSRSTC